MPFLALIISGAIPDSSKGKVTEIMPAVISAIKSAPGVKNVYAGAVVAENHAAATQTKICHIIEFESLQAAEALKTGGHMDALKVSLGLNDFPEPEVKEMYEVEKFPQPADLQAVTQITRITLNDPSSAAEVRAGMEKTMSSSSPNFGGKNLKTDGAGIFIRGYAGKEEIEAAMHSDVAVKAREGFAKAGTEVTIMATLQSS